MVMAFKHGIFITDYAFKTYLLLIIVLMLIYKTNHMFKLTS